VRAETARLCGNFFRKRPGKISTVCYWRSQLHNGAAGEGVKIQAHTRREELSDRVLDKAAQSTLRGTERRQT
jgi:hypothetical protein